MPSLKALFLGAGFVLGVLAASALVPAAPLALGAGLAGIACLTGAWLSHRDPALPVEGQLLPQVRAVVAVLALVGIACLGFTDLGIREAVRRRSPLEEMDGRVVELQGRLATDPQPVGTAWGFTLRSITGPEGAGFPGRMAVRSFEKKAPIGAVGDLVGVEVKVRRLDLSNAFDVVQARNGIAAEGALVMPVMVIAHSGNPLVRASNFFRERMESAANQALSPNRAALVLGFVIGDDRALSARVRDDFRASGLSHLTAVSGANLAMVLGALALLLKFLKASRRVSVAVGLAAIVLFAVVTRWEPSVLRASVMATIALGAFVFGRLPTSLNTLAVAFFGLLLFDPSMLWSIGFQLSFAATAGILLLRKPIVDRLPSVPRLLLEPMAIGLAAQAAVFPVIALQFGKISVAALPANLAAAAFVTPVTVIGLVGGVLSMLSGHLAWPFMKVAGLFAWVLQSVARTFGRSDVSQVKVPNFNGLEFVAACLLLAAAWLLLTRRYRRARWPALGAAVLMLATMLAPMALSAPPGGLRVTFFDVGQGDAALVESPEGARVLVDGGPDPEMIAGELSRRGLNRIDLVVASHLHADHVTGLTAVFQRFDVGIAIHPGVKTYFLPTLSVDEPLEEAHDGERIQIGDLVVEILGPRADLRAIAVSAGQGGGVEGPELNDASIALRVLWGGQCVLFTGDLQEAGQQALMEEHPQQIECTVLKAPHHGSGRLDPEFVKAVDPEFVSVSVGPNDYGQPSQKALKIFEAAGAQVLRTDRSGNVVIEISGSGAVRSL